MKDNFEETIGYVVSVLKEAGYEPYEQLYAYASTGNEAYITRRGDARTIVTTLARDQITNFLQSIRFPNSN